MTKQESADLNIKDLSFINDINSIAVIGPSRRRDFYFLRTHAENFKGKLYAVHPKVKEIPRFNDENIYPSLLDIPGDIDYVTMSDWITFVLNRGDQPCGSYLEAGIAMEHRIPVYLVTDYIKSELPKSLLQCIEVSGGEVFPNENKFFAFLDEKYGLIRKEEKEEEEEKD